jgi:hypothetical protein
VLRGEGPELDKEAGLTPVSAHGLLAPTIDQPTVWPVVHVRPEMVADLHEPRLVISPDYVGRDRRHGLVLPPRYAPARSSTHRMALAVLVALVTTAAVVPLTLMVAHDAPTTTGPAGAAHTQLHPVATAQTPRAPRVRPARAGTAPSARSAAHRERSSGRAAARSARAAAAADQQAARAARASSRAEQRSAAQGARATRRSEAQAARAARRASG